MSTPELTLHVVPLSHPCMTVEAALAMKGLDFERIELQTGRHPKQIEEIYGEGNVTVPAMKVGDEQFNDSVSIMGKIEELAPDPPLYPSDRDAAVRDAEAWGESVLQGAARRLIWGALHFRPEAMGTYGGAGPLDPAGTDFAIKALRGFWKYLGISAELLAADMEQMPGHLNKVDELVAEGTIGGEAPNAADLQIASSLRMMLTIGDVAALMCERPAQELALRIFPEYPGHIPGGAFPASWNPPG